MRRRPPAAPDARRRSLVPLLVALLALGATVPAVAAPEPRDARTLGVPVGVSAVLVEAASGQVLAAHDADRRRPVASTVKLVTALVAADALPPGTLVVPGEEVLGIEGASAGLRPGEPLTADELLVALLLRSGNDAAAALAVAAAGSEAAFVTSMEARLAALGIEVDLASASGLSEDDRLSALELAVVARAVLGVPRLAGPAAAPQLVAADGSVVENRNGLLGVLDGATGLKTGYTAAAGWSLVGSAERDGRTLVAVVLGAVDDAQRIALAAGLLTHGFDATTVLAPRGEVVLRTGRGEVLLRAVAAPLTVPVGSEARPAWPIALDPDAPPGSIPVALDDRPVAVATVTVEDARTGRAGSAGLGAAAATGVYAALRASGSAGLLG